MAFLVQQKFRRKYYTFRAVAISAAADPWYNKFGLFWERVGEPSRTKNGALPLVNHYDGTALIDCGCAAITREEAEQATGLYAPACWDKILDDV